MKLDRFEYISNEGLSNEWRLDECRLSQINLIVGKNARGKSRIVKAIYNISEILLSKKVRSIVTGKAVWRLYFDESEEYSRKTYILEINQGVVIQEKLLIGNKEYLTRDESGIGEIRAEQLDMKMKFQTPTKELAAVNRRDAVQHPFLDDLYQWANSLRFYEFGTQLGKNVIAHIPQKVDFLKDKTDFKDYDYVVGIFCLGINEIGDKFIQSIIDDMKEIGYEISEIGLKIPDDIMNMMQPESSENLPQFLYVKEADLNSVTEQSDMSQGMFRCLSLLIQTNYSLLSDKPSCILIDDIGEGLDYQRSAAIIKILIDKANFGSVQLIMTSNDEYIMNGVPLEYWSVIERTSGKVKLHNYFNAEDKFKEFEFLGLNNFDFFTSEFALAEELGEE